MSFVRALGSGKSTPDASSTGSRVSHVHDALHSTLLGPRASGPLRDDACWPGAPALLRTCPSELEQLTRAHGTA